jgi:uncharacterized protein (TIGR03118 family)
MHYFSALAAWGALLLLVLSSAPVQAEYVQTNLVSDIAAPPGGAPLLIDPDLVNPWGMSFSATSPFWVSDTGTSRSTLYTVSGTSSVTKNPTTNVVIPTTGSGLQGPTGQVQNNQGMNFLVGGTPASFIFANLNGQISAWNAGLGPTGPAVVTAMGVPGSIYTGLAIGSNPSGSFLYAANNALGRIDVFNGSFAPTSLAGSFVDPVLPAGLAPFNVQNINGQLYVTYSLPYPSGARTAPLGSGAVAIFDTNGNFIRQLTAGGNLASPWGVALAPDTFGEFGGDLLVGNFSFTRSEINAFDPVTGAYVGTISDASGNPILLPGLWALLFGNGGSGGDRNTLYFTAGIQGETHGLFGGITGVVPEPGTAVLLGLGGLLLFGLRAWKVRKASRTVRGCEPAVGSGE